MSAEGGCLGFDCEVGLLSVVGVFCAIWLKLMMFPGTSAIGMPCHRAASGHFDKRNSEVSCGGWHILSQ